MSFDITPSCAAKTAQFWISSIWAKVAANSICLVDWHIQLGYIRVFDPHVFPFNSVNRTIHQTSEAADAVVNMYDKVTRPQICIVSFWRFCYRAMALAWFRPAPAKYFSIRIQVLIPLPSRAEVPPFC
jgi:hypothetical protein